VRLWLRLTLVSAVLVLTPMVTMGWLTIQTTQEVLDVQPAQEVHRDGVALATFVTTWLDGHRASVSGWQRVWDVRHADDGYRTGLLRAAYQGMEDAVVVQWVDGKGAPYGDPVYLGRAIGGERGLTPQAADVYAEGLTAQLSGERPSIGDAHVLPGRSHASVTLVGPAIGDSWRLAVDVDLEPLAGLFVAEEEEDARAALLLAGDGRVVIGDALDPLAQAQLMEVVGALGTQQSVVFEPGSLNGALRGSVVGVPGTPWAVAVVEPAVRSGQAVARLRKTMGQIAIGILGTLALLAWALQNLITRRVDSLQQRVQRIAMGHLDETIELKGRDELSALGADVERMRRSLQETMARNAAQRDEIEAFNAQLQARVEEATAELRSAQAELIGVARQEAVTEVSQGLAHELNNPLMGIMGLAELGQIQGNLKDVQLQQIVQLARRCRDVMAELSRVVRGQIDPMDATVVDLVELVRKVAEDAAQRLRERNVLVHLQLPSDPMLLSLPATLLRNAIRRLLGAWEVSLRDGAQVWVELVNDPEPQLVLRTDADPSREGDTDAFRAQGASLWVGRQILDRAGHLDESTPSRTQWRPQTRGA